MITVIGLVGAKQSGKTTAFKKIASLVNAGEITLAGKLKTVCSEIFNIPRSCFEESEKKERELEDLVFLNKSNLEDVFDAYSVADFDFNKHIRGHIGTVLHTPREVLQYVGTEVIRSYDSDLHCKKAVEAIHSTTGLYVVTDIRFPNEFDFFTNYFSNFTPIYIKNIVAELVASKDRHSSEGHLGQLAQACHITLNNNRGMSDFHVEITKTIKLILQGRLQ